MSPLPPYRLLISGIYRTGTTLVQKMLDTHPALDVLYQPSFAFFKMLDRLYHTQYLNTAYHDRPLGVDVRLAQTETAWLQHIHFGEQDLEALLVQQRRILERGDSTQKGRAYPDLSFLDDLTEHLTPGTAHEVLEQIYAGLHAYRRRATSRATRYIGFKEIFIDAFLPPVLEVYPAQMRVIHIVRDPRAVLASRNYGTYRTSESASRHPLLLVANLWNTSAAYHTHLARHFEHALTLRYEDLADNTEDVARTICTFLDVPFDPAMTDPAQYRDERGASWHRNTSFPDRQSTSQWQSVLPPPAVGAIEFLCREGMEKLTYAPTHTFAEQRAHLHAYTEETADLVSWTRQPDFLLDARTKEHLLGSPSSESR